MNPFLRSIPLQGALYNIVGGVFLLILPIPLADLFWIDPVGNPVLRYFVAGTAITFGLSYLGAFRDPQGYRIMVRFGTGLKMWAFAISSYAFFKGYSNAVLFVVFGLGNFLLALEFAFWLFRRPTTA